ncbi:hypothetical protein BKA93DRAFT_806217 [Sparassis latifolia]
MSALSSPPPSPTCALFAQYSPLFTSGLLSDPRVPTKRRKCAHDSFPLTVNTASLSFSGVLRSSLDLVEDSTLFLTLAPRRRVPEGRSFLSLDLAESQSMRSVSLRRKDTVTTRATAATFFGRSEPSSPSALSPLSCVSFPCRFPFFLWFGVSVWRACPLLACLLAPLTTSSHLMFLHLENVWYFCAILPRSRSFYRFCRFLVPRLPFCAVVMGLACCVIVLPPSQLVFAHRISSSQS